MRTDRLGFDLAYATTLRRDSLTLSVSFFTNDECEPSGLSYCLVVVGEFMPHSQESTRIDRFVLARRDHRLQIHRLLEAS